jgi:membrane protein insertase Oxa1/YidC/SpoIIIJ
MGRNAGAEVSQQQQLMMRIGPLMYVFFAFVSPAAICVYFLVSTLWRVGQQHYITRSLYHGEDSVGVQAQKAMAELREAKKKEAASKGGAAKKVDATGNRAASKSSVKPSGNGSSAKPQDAKPAAKATAGAGASGVKPHPRSRKKKKRK